MHDLYIRFLVQIFGRCIFFGLKWWKIAKKWVLTHPRGFRSWKWGQNALYSKTWILRPDWRGSAFLSFPCQWVDGKLLFLHQGDLLNPLEYLIEEKKNFFSKNLVLWFFQKKIEFFPLYPTRPRNLKFFIKDKKFFSQFVVHTTKKKSARITDFFSGERKNTFD